MFFFSFLDGIFLNICRKEKTHTHSRTGSTHGEKDGRQRKRNVTEKKKRCVCFFSLTFSLPADNLVEFSVTFIREGDLVHLKRQMKELEANYQEIEKR